MALQQRTARLVTRRASGLHVGCNLTLAIAAMTGWVELLRAA